MILEEMPPLKLKLERKCSIISRMRAVLKLKCLFHVLSREGGIFIMCYWNDVLITDWGKNWHIDLSGRNVSDYQNQFYRVERDPTTQDCMWNDNSLCCQMK